MYGRPGLFFLVCNRALRRVAMPEHSDKDHATEPPRSVQGTVLYPGLSIPNVIACTRTRGYPKHGTFCPACFLDIVSDERVTNNFRADQENTD